MALQNVSILTLEDRVLFPSTYTRISVTKTNELQLLKHLLSNFQDKNVQNARWNGRASGHGEDKNASLQLGVFTTVQAKESEKKDMYHVGTYARIVQLTKLKDNTGLEVVLQGLYRVRIDKVVHNEPFILANVSKCSPTSSSPSRKALEEQATRLKALTQKYFEFMKDSALIKKAQTLFDSIQTESVGDLADIVTAYLNVAVDSKLKVLGSLDIPSRVQLASNLLQEEIDRLSLRKRINNEVQGKLDENRKEFLLRQQLEAIKKELGESDHENGGDSNSESVAKSELKLLEERIDALDLKNNPRAESTVKRELKRLKGMSPNQPEHGLLTNYLEFFADLPWSHQTKDIMNVQEVAAQLDKDHYGLDKVKKRIKEYIAVRSLKKDLKGPILCLVGPSGVGKTSLAKSIATATGRAFEKVSLGGVHDESEIRGHRKTYIGAMPGSILSALRSAGSKNPVVLLDEVDKLGKDVRGDPASALLEVLDPNQNDAFSDHFLNVPFDLSNVLFLATANSLDTIPTPLLDRMEVIDVSGYSVEQKVEIGVQYLVPRQLDMHGVKPTNLVIERDALKYIVTNYTREAGVRELERQIAAVCRYAAVGIVRMREAEDGDISQECMTVKKENVPTILGPELVFNEIALRSSAPGVATGMSWSSVGGSILFVEASCTRMSTNFYTQDRSNTNGPRLQLTGKLGDVMKESARLALSWIRTNGDALKLSNESRLPSIDQISDVHVHFPEGAVPKDGPSAGCAIVSAVVSALAGVSVPNDLAMTGEITLRGVILPVGGIREKVLAAIRAGIKRVVLPSGNRAEAQELKREFTAVTIDSEEEDVDDRVRILFVSDLKELLALVFGMQVSSTSAEERSGRLGSKRVMLLSRL